VQAACTLAAAVDPDRLLRLILVGLLAVGVICWIFVAVFLGYLVFEG